MTEIEPQQQPPCREDVYERLEEIHDKVKDIRRSVYGNGDVGLSERVRLLEHYVESVQSWGKWIKFGVGGLFLKALWDILLYQPVP